MQTPNQSSRICPHCHCEIKGVGYVMGSSPQMCEECGKEAFNKRLQRIDKKRDDLLTKRSYEIRRLNKIVDHLNKEIAVLTAQRELLSWERVQ